MFLNKKVRPLRGRPLWGRPCSWVRACLLTERPLPWQRGHPVQGGQGSLRHLPNIKLIGQQAAKLWGFFLPTMQLAAVTLTSDPLTLKLVHGVLVSQGPFLPSLVFVGLFVFPLGGGTGQTDRINTWWGLLLRRWFGGLVAEQLGRWIRDRKVHGLIPSRCTTKLQLWANCSHLPACVGEVSSGYCQLVTYRLQFDSHCWSFASNIEQVSNLLCA